jgi:hypothetical protein
MHSRPLNPNTMAKPYEVIEKDGYRINIYMESEPRNPREDGDNLTTMACKHRRYQLGDKEARIEGDQCDWLMSLLGFNQAQIDWYERKYGQQNNALLAALLNRLDDNFYWLPLYLYDHSGITMRTGSFNDHWDSGQVGIIYVRKEKAITEGFTKAYMNKHYPGKTIREGMEEILRADVKTYDQFLTGDTYGYMIGTVDEDGDETEDGGCWGFYGTDWANNGLLDYAENEVECLVKEAKKVLIDTTERAQPIEVY